MRKDRESAEEEEWGGKSSTRILYWSLKHVKEFIVIKVLTQGSKDV